MNEFGEILTIARSEQLAGVLHTRLWGALKMVVLDRTDATRWREIMMAALVHSDDREPYSPQVPLQNLFDEASFAMGLDQASLIRSVAMEIVEHQFSSADAELNMAFSCTSVRALKGMAIWGELGMTILDSSPEEEGAKSCLCAALGLLSGSETFHEEALRAIAERLGVQFHIQRVASTAVAAPYSLYRFQW